MRRSLNSIRLNTAFLNGVIAIPKRGQGGGGGGDVPDIPDIPDVPVEPDEPVVPGAPDGYEEFLAMDGVFSAADGEFYVKL